MKNKMIFALMALVISFVSISCNKDTDDPNPNVSDVDIIGKWELIEAVEDGEDIFQSRYGVGSHITFYENKTCTLFYTRDNYKWNGAWHFDGYGLIIADEIYLSEDEKIAISIDGESFTVKKYGDIMELNSTSQYYDGNGTHIETLYWKIQRISEL